jgi:hypothetical protein
MDEKTIYNVIIFPRPWPPQADHEFTSEKLSGPELNLIADKDGRLILTIHPSAQDTRVYRFQPIRIEGSGRAIITMTLAKEGARLYLNAKEVRLDEDAQGEPMVLKTKDDPLPPRELILGSMDLNTAKSQPEYLFLGTVADIDRKVLDGSDYNLLRAAGLLRQLFLDPTPLVHVVNCTYRQKIKFETVDYRLQPPLPPQAHMRNLDSSLFPGAKTVKNDLKDFLKAPCFKIDTTTATVRDLIRACAHVKGGVHFGKAKTSEDKVVLDWDRMVRLFGKQPSLRAVAGVCRVALRGLKPLVEAIARGGAGPNIDR